MTSIKSKNSPIIVDRKCPAWNFLAIFGELQHENINTAWCHSVQGRHWKWRGELQTVIKPTCTPLTSFPSSENWIVHYPTRISHPAPLQTAPTFSKNRRRRAGSDDSEQSQDCSNFTSEGREQGLTWTRSMWLILKLMTPCWCPCPADMSSTTLSCFNWKIPGTLYRRSTRTCVCSVTVIKHNQTVSLSLCNINARTYRNL